MNSSAWEKDLRLGSLNKAISPSWRGATIHKLPRSRRIESPPGSVSATPEMVPLERFRYSTWTSGKSRFASKSRALHGQVRGALPRSWFCRNRESLWYGLFKPAIMRPRSRNDTSREGDFQAESVGGAVDQLKVGELTMITRLRKAVPFSALTKPEHGAG
jgi:hypothetical protein